MSGGKDCQLWTIQGNLLANARVTKMVHCRGIRPPHEAPSVHHIEQALEVAPNVMEVILLVDLNVRKNSRYQLEN